MARYLITSALPYINGIKHLGNLAVFEPAGNRSDDYAESLRRAYLEYQFIRLGLRNQPAACAPPERNLQAVLPGTEAGAPQSFTWRNGRNRPK